MAAGVAFFSFLALFPAMIAAVLLYGLVADPATAPSRPARSPRRCPGRGQPDHRPDGDDHLRPQQSLGLGLIVAMVLALWSASGGVGNLISAVNMAYDEEETRGFVKRKVLALGLTLGAILFVVVAVGAGRRGTGRAGQPGRLRPVAVGPRGRALGLLLVAVCIALA